MFAQEKADAIICNRHEAWLNHELSSSLRIRNLLGKPCITHLTWMFLKAWISGIDLHYPIVASASAPFGV